MMKLRIFVLALLALAVSAADAQARYKILFVNTSEIEIGDRICRVGDVFSENDEIRWSKPQQAMRVSNIANGRQSAITADGFRKTKSSSLRDYMLQEHKMARRQGEALSLIDLGVALNDTLLLLDVIEFDTTFPTDTDRFFYAKFEYQGETINKMLKPAGNKLFIDREVYIIDGNGIKPQPMLMQIYYYDGINQVITKVSDQTYIIPLPYEI